MSADMNNLQRLATRQVGELMRYLGQRYVYPSGSPGAYGSSDAQGLPVSWCAGLVVEAASATTYSINPGVLCSASAANLLGGHDDLDSSTVMGFLRAAAVRPMPTPNPTRTGGEYFLISARIVANVTLNTVVEIFDIPTQTFVPMAKDKRVEYELEFREDAGPQVPSLPALGALPLLTAAPGGQGWDPIAIIKAIPDTGHTDHGQVIDVRRDIRDLVRMAPLDPIPSYDARWFPPDVSIRRIESVAHPSDDNITFGYRGFFRATLREQEFSFAAPFGLDSSALLPNDLETLVPGVLTHVYMVPYKVANSGRIPSWQQRNNVSGNRVVYRGFLVAAQAGCPPTRDGKNSASLQLPGTGATGIYTALPVVGVGEAVHVFSAQSRASNSLAFVPFTMSGGRLVYGLNALFNNEMSGPRVTTALTLAAGSTVHSLPLSAHVPRNARWVELGVRIANGGTADGPARCEVRIAKEDAKIGGTSALTTTWVLDSITVPCGYANSAAWGKMRIPLPTPNPGDSGLSELSYFSLAVEFAYQVPTGSTFGSATGEVYVIGWDLGQ